MKRRWALSTILILLLGACSGIGPKKPDVSVTVTGVSLVPGDALVPDIKITLHIVNTSPVDIKLKGVVYRLFIENRKVLTGATRDLPAVLAYSERDIDLKAAPDLMETLGLFKDLTLGLKTSLRYKLEMDIDAGTLIPTIHKKKEGVLSLSEAVGVK